MRVRRPVSARIPAGISSSAAAKTGRRQQQAGDRVAEAERGLQPLEHSADQPGVGPVDESDGGQDQRRPPTEGRGRVGSTVTGGRSDEGVDLDQGSGDRRRASHQHSRRYG